MAPNIQIRRRVKGMTIEKPDPFNLRMEMKVRPKDDKDITGFDRAREIEAQINKMAEFDFCGFVSKTTQPRLKEPECVTFIAGEKIKNFGLFVKQLKTELGIDVQYKWGTEN